VVTVVQAAEPVVMVQEQVEPQQQVEMLVVTQQDRKSVV
jgi:hypothetical protein